MMRTSNTRIVLGIWCLAMGVTAWGETIQRCTLPDGSTGYGDICANTQESEEIEIHPGEGGGSSYGGARGFQLTGTNCRRSSDNYARATGYVNNSTDTVESYEVEARFLVRASVYDTGTEFVSVGPYDRNAFNIVLSTGGQSGQCEYVAWRR